MASPILPPPFLGNSLNLPMACLSAHNQGDLYDELWQACAGPLVYVPRPGDRVWYFPQGHMEQISASTQTGCTQVMPNTSGLAPQIFCRVLARSFSADLETDDVSAQLSLLPELDLSEPCLATADDDERLFSSPRCPSSAPHPEADSAPLPSPSVSMFIKILTASDTSTHGGFSVLRKHAEECLPPLDMSRDPPFQDLVATDLHGHEWKFRHTYRGNPRRHLFTTGWSVFVSHKRLATGDAVIFVRGENGVLRVGIRKAKRQPSTLSLVLSSHSMHMGVVATASRAVSTRTMFSVIYQPRVCPFNFLVPVEKLAKAMAVSVCLGARFKMRLENEDATERSHAGTIVGISDLDNKSWPNSKWRCLIVKWDDMRNDRLDRVSQWEIEMDVSSPSPPARRIKHVHSSSSSIGTHVEAGNKRFSMLPLESVSSTQSSRVMQVQDHLFTGMINDLSKNTGGQQLGGVPATLPVLQLPSKRRPLCLSFCAGGEGELTHSVSSPKVSNANNHHCSLGVSELSNQDAVPASAENSCRLFGITLASDTSSPSLRGMPSTHGTTQVFADNINCMIDRTINPQKKCKGIDIPGHRKSDPAPGKENPDQNFVEDPESPVHSVRSCTKVIKKGSKVGRGIDLFQLTSYETLFQELELMFNMDGKLTDPETSWCVAYCDNEGDMLHVGDDPWLEFCGMARKIHIFNRDEVTSGSPIKDG